METKKKGSIGKNVHPVHHGHPAEDQAEGEREVIDQALANQAKRDINQDKKQQQQRIDRQRGGREMRQSPQMGRQGKKAA